MGDGHRCKHPKAKVILSDYLQQTEIQQLCALMNKNNDCPYFEETGGIKCMRYYIAKSYVCGLCGQWWLQTNKYHLECVKCPRCNNCGTVLK